MNLENIILSERNQDIKGHILSDSFDRKCPEEANL